MKCSACSQELPAEAFGPLVCPQCGTVNVSFGAEHVPPARAAGRAPLPRHQRLALIQAAAAVALLLVGGAVAAYSLQAPHRPAPVAVATATPTATPAATPTATPTPSPTLTLAPTPAKATPTVPPTLDAQMASINQTLSRYHLTITLSPANNAGTYSTWSTLTKDDVYTLKTFAPYLTEEWSKYPTDLVHNSGLKTIGLVKDLKVSTQARAAAPAPSIDGMLYDVNAMANAGSEYAREVVSHEYWHYLDYVGYGTYTYSDATWDACNPAGFTYGSGGGSAYNNPNYVAAFHPQADFITTYSTYGREEDRAEMFGWLMYAPAKVKALGDSGINCKINRLTTLVHTLSPGMSF